MLIRKCLVGLVLLLCASQANAESLYFRFWVTDLGVLGKQDGPSAERSTGFAVNESSVVVGTSTTDSLVPGANSEDHGFIYKHPAGLENVHTYGTMEDLGPLIGQVGKSSARDINGSNTVVGTSAGQAYRYNSTTGVMRPLGTLGGSNSDATGINDAGTVVGHSSLAGSVSTHAFVYDDVNGMQDLQDLGGLAGVSSSYATSINNSGEITGNLRMTDGSNRAFLYDEANGMQVLAGGTSSWGQDISSSGDIAGYFTDSEGATHAFLHNDTNGMLDLDTLGGTSSYGFGVNEFGRVVGTSTIAPGSNDTRAFIYDATYGLMDLNNRLVDAQPDWTLLAAYSISDDQRITGYGLLDGELHAFLLTPVPEPATWAALISMGLMGLFGFWRRSRKTA